MCVCVCLSLFKNGSMLFSKLVLTFITDLPVTRSTLTSPLNYWMCADWPKLIILSCNEQWLDFSLTKPCSFIKFSNRSHYQSHLQEIKLTFCAWNHDFNLKSQLLSPSFLTSNHFQSNQRIGWLNYDDTISWNKILQ